MLFLKQPFILPFLYHESATTSQVDSNKVSNSTLKPELCSCMKLEINESIAPPQQPQSQGTNCLGHPFCVEITQTRLSKD